MKKLISAALVVALVAMMSFVGCSAGNDTESNPESSSQETTAEDLQAAFLESTNAFAGSFTTQVVGTSSENICVSPISLYYALAMLTSGVQGDAQQQLLEVMHAESAEKIEEMCSSQLVEFAAETDTYKLVIANSIWAANDYSFTDEFKKIATEDFASETFSVDFGTAAANAQMNKWVSDKTNNLLNPNFTTQDSQIASLINTIYFKDAWVSQFDTSETKDSVFHTIEGDVQAQFMNRIVEGVGYTQLENCIMAELYFTSGATMTFYLPNEGVSPSNLIATPEQTAQLLSAQPESYENINFSIPKFKLSTTKNDIAETLMALGVKDIFTNESGDVFNSMLKPKEVDKNKADAAKGSSASSSASAQSGDKAANANADAGAGAGVRVPVVSEIQQGTCLTVEEEGVEAAAYTEVGIARTSMGDDKVPIDFVLDRPFFFKLTAPDTTVLFTGIVQNPVSSAVS